MNTIRAFLCFVAICCVRWTGFPLELVVHFRAHLLVVTIVILCVALKRRGTVESLVAASLLGFLVVEVLPFYIRGSSSNVLEPELRVYSANVSVFNNQSDGLIADIQSRHPDVIALSEVTRAFRIRLEPLRSDYPYQADFEGRLYSGPVFLSKHKIVRSRFSQDTAHLEVELDFGGGVTALYMPSADPTSALGLERRNHALQVLRDTVNRQPGPKIILGDLNSSPWSEAYRALLREASLHDARLGYGLQPTFPAGIHPLGIPIDHCLVTREVIVRDFRSIAVPGSDHRGILCRVVLPQALQPGTP